jgi:hypothetical protein
MTRQVELAPHRIPAGSLGQMVVVSSWHLWP